ALASDLAIDSNDRLVVSWFTAGGGMPQNLRLTRYEPDGRVDTTFGSSGTVFVTFIPLYGGARIAEQADGGIVVTGDGREGDHQDIAVGRYDSTGTLDRSFG